MESKITPELLEKAKKAKSAEELLALAKENGVELSKEEAQAYFEQFNKTGELSDDELDNVAGGGCHAGDGRMVVTVFHHCKHFCCRRCGGKLVNKGEGDKCSGFRCNIYAQCCECKFCTYEKGLWLCNNPENKG